MKRKSEDLNADRQWRMSCRDEHLSGRLGSIVVVVLALDAVGGEGDELLEDVDVDESSFSWLVARFGEKAIERRDRKRTTVVDVEGEGCGREACEIQVGGTALLIVSSAD